MNYKKLLNEVAAKTHVDEKDVDSVLESMFERMGVFLDRGDTLAVYSFGIFSMKHKQSKRMYNPKTKTTEVVSAREDLAFHVSPTFKDKCYGKQE